MSVAPSLADSTLARSLLRPWDHRALALACGYVFTYVLVDWLSNVKPLLSLGITPWNPQAGLALAFLLYFGPRWLPVAVVAAVTSDAFVRGTSMISPATLFASLWVACVYAGLAAILRRWQLAAPISTAIGAARFAGASVIGTLVVAVGYIGVFVSVGYLLLEDAARGTTRYWVGDLTGVLTLTPLLMHLSRWRAFLSIARKHAVELLFQLSVVVLSLWFVFSLPADDQLRFFYLLFIPVIWIAMSWGLPGGALGVLAIQIGLAIVAQSEIPIYQFIYLQFLMLTLSLMALFLGAVVTERAGVLQRVAAREAEQRALLAMAPDGVIAVDESGKIRMANSAATRLFGERMQAQADRRVSDVLPGLHLESEDGRATLQGRRADGATFPAEIAWARLDPPANEGFLVTVRDATDRLRAEEQLRGRDAALARAMRFAVAGELASALTHELNQPITALVSYLRASEILADRAPAQEDRLKGTLGKAAMEAMRASEVLRRLRDFYRAGTLKWERIQIRGLCEAAANAFQDRLRQTGVSLSVEIDPSVPSVESDRTQLEIVLHNLIGNAIDSLAHHPVARRHIEVTADWNEVDLSLRVEDSGPGVPAGLASRLFDAFVTSKPDGMGLGLAISRSLIRARGGELFYAPSQRLGGAAFTIRVPFTIPTDPPLN
jgi:two-component system, LuxR family, sensor kinase FixL